MNHTFVSNKYINYKQQTRKKPQKIEKNRKNSRKPKNKPKNNIINIPNSIELLV